MIPNYEYPALFARQDPNTTVFVFCAPAKDILKFAQINRIGRNSSGQLRGFQRPQVAGHIKEIREYLAQDDAVLPNSVVIAFMEGVEFDQDEAGKGTINIRMSNDDGPPGLVVDGQQRLSALAQLQDKDFQVFVTGIICHSEDELRKQFILINNTRPLPKTLIYELLPTVAGLPHRLSSRSLAAKLIELLNYDERSSLKGQIKQHTNPTGVLQDTVIQKFIMSSLSDGVLRERINRQNGLHACFTLISNFFDAVQRVFPDAWKWHKPRTSRLVHGAGIIGMGYVMEHLCTTESAETSADFEAGLMLLKGKTAWTEGVWAFGPENVRPWNGLQFVPRDYMDLSQYLVRTVRSAQRSRSAQPSHAEETIA